MHGDVVRLELKSLDPERSAAFYAKLLGWRPADQASPTRRVFQTPSGLEGAWVALGAIEAPGPIPYLAVPDLEASLRAVEEEGGRILVRQLATAGALRALCADPDGNVIGLEQVAEEAAPVQPPRPASKSKPTVAKPAARPARPAKPAAKVGASKPPKARR